MTPRRRREAPQAFEFETMLKACALCAALWAAPLLSHAAEQAPPAPAAASADPALSQVVDWVVASGDNQGLPFVVIDKVAAKVFVFSPDGRPRGDTTALLGLAVGDDSVPGIGDRPLSQIRPEERTTPAGRFVARFGPSLGHGRVLWVDYATAISLHPVVTSNPKERRLERLRTPTPQDNRISYGCINVSPVFYDEVILPTFGGGDSIFYILPETKPLDEVFPALRRPDGAGVKSASTDRAAP